MVRNILSVAVDGPVKILQLINRPLATLKSPSEVIHNVGQFVSPSNFIYELRFEPQLELLGKPAK